MVSEAAAASGGAWTVSIMNPGMVWGPCLTKAHTKASPSFVRQHLYGVQQPSISFAVVDVRDVAAAHVAAAEAAEGEGGAAGRHVLVGGGELFTAELGARLQALFPELEVETGALSGFWVWFAALNPCYAGLTVHMATTLVGVPFHYSAKKATAALGMKWRSLDQTLKDTVDSMVDTGFVKPRRRKKEGGATKMD
jgi:nucleoside-diphosphate-sugar epimerase